MTTEEKSMLTISPAHPSFLISSPKVEFPNSKERQSIVFKALLNRVEYK
jgi:hypothetical protein